MKQIFDDVSFACSKVTTRAYSTSFSLGIRFLDRHFHDPIYAIYGFVRCADEVVDSFHGYDKAGLLEDFKHQTWQAIQQGISTNPILNSFQYVVKKYGIDADLINGFFASMEADLNQTTYTEAAYQQYIFGSAEVVGLMCLKVFTENDQQLYERLTPPARKLGAAFQKVNFLRDIRADYLTLGRTYFPGVNFTRFTWYEKEKIQADITSDFEEALAGIRQLPVSSRKGVYLAYFYYRKLFMMIKNVPAEKTLTARIRIPNHKKIGLMFQSMIRHQLNLL
jgi:phytoene/squalene synthetase